MSITYIFEDLNEVARHLEEQANRLRLTEARTAKQRLTNKAEASAYESVANMLRNTKLGD